MPSDYAIHSDLLVYWTGKDIEEQHGTTRWFEEESSDTRGNECIEAAYLERLKSILQHGLWMTNQKPPKIDGLEIPEAACTCFTELKLSQSRKHAVQYGRLGIAFKRPFVFNRGGRPVVYYAREWMSRDPLLDKWATDKHLMHFFKPMNSGDSLNYDLYSESEWRIVFADQQYDDGKIVNPRKPKSKEVEDYFNSLKTDSQEKLLQPNPQDKLRYLIPLDGWLALIIYPTVSIKNKAQRDSEIRSLIQDIKGDETDHANRVEDGNLPTEMDLDLCRNF